MNKALVSSPLLAAQGVVFPYTFCRHGVRVLRALRLSKKGKVRFLPSTTCRNTLCVPTRNGFACDEEAARGETGLRQLFGRKQAVLERREHTRYGVRALVDFEWMDEGVLRRGQGLTRDINAKGMFIYSDIKPPAKADLRVEVSFQNFASIPTNLQMKADGLVIRVEPATEQGSQQGFAILNRSYELHNGVNALQN
jgi:hypothetical protein